ncbi:hypothetical protein D3C83_232010 [compost metagenome]
MWLGNRAQAAAPADAARVHIEQCFQPDERRLRLENVRRVELVAIPQHRDAAADSQFRAETRRDTGRWPKHDDA